MVKFFTEDKRVIGKFGDEIIENLKFSLNLSTNSGSMFHGSDGSIANNIKRKNNQVADQSALLYSLLQSELHFYRML
jgi:hypothetical protein